MFRKRIIYKRIKKSDIWGRVNRNGTNLLDKFVPFLLTSPIYSFGVILWEILNGRPPFQSLNIYAVIIHISKGGREIPVEGTPDSYIQLYKRCWNYDPNQHSELGKRKF
ncbi:hypothetical protein C2G38_587461 [Gigaspora rosea]|uniref:Serine-threonine/tyrosine-protein kinase catalytic domain-containing protein n=1 Tax=Gigaspora rosea TaxID=44941 RepID=A0A397U5Q1_9GLOM|nr:hypothetical protein C2G38_587461 [Gigaspora rosea]